jgi:glycosyltransferase involved in cell wall biosynthesis
MNYAALDETIQYGKKIKGDIYDNETLKEYKEALIYALKHPEWQEKQRKLMMPWAKKTYSWTRVAEQWTDEFRGINIDDAIDVVVKEKSSAGKFMPLDKQKKHGLKETS